MRHLLLVFSTFFLVLLCPFVNAQGIVQLYSDSDCTIPSGATQSLLHDSCLPQIQAGGIKALSLPSCDHGSALLVLSDLEQCKKPTLSPLVQSGNINQCLSLPAGNEIGSVGFVCVAEVTTVSYSQPAATTTAPSPPRSTFDTVTASATQSPPSQDIPPPPPPGPGLSVSDRIALGCGIGIGVPTLIVGFLAWWINLRQHHRPAARLRLVAGDGPPPPYELVVHH